MKTTHSMILAGLLIGGSLPAAAGEPNTLTPQELSDGWILLFDGNTLFGWKSVGNAQWVVRDSAIESRSGAGFLETTTEFADFRLRADFWIDEAADSGVFFRCPAEGAIDSASACEVNIRDAHERWPTGSICGVAPAAVKASTTGRWTGLDLTAEGDRISVRLDGRTVLETTDARFARGAICLQQFDGKGTVRFRNLKIRPLGLRSIFNGKDLTGWREIPGHKSVYSVTPEGWLNVKNGNGDLQSAGQYGDFIFQLEIISNGTHLNSGVFFRALPGQFWSGYESQIRNQWEGNDRAKPVDFGTGAIYNRQAARRVIPNDREWFQKTIVAHGRHLAVWVNGIMVSDFLDSRPPHENARQGYRAQAGVLSLQGHDPTTDLSFRNLQVVELPPARR
ncbi:MAG TPA: DUF1080 domain-containing protein [Candidatus Paceibacterota bacterium]|nr:DUF1080 domain-containing protein [Verrucomicrobiota bacterium]HRZ43779.1 DUF1080 domain-containing protein [Candidatus Paceibacterota bacterium]